MTKGQMTVFGNEEVQKPGIRGGKFYRTEKGKVVYGQKPTPKPRKKKIEASGLLALFGSQPEKIKEHQKELQGKVEKETDPKKKVELIKQQALIEMADEKKEQLKKDNKLYSIDEFNDYIKRAVQGKVTPKELREQFEKVVENEKAIKAYLGTMTKQQLLSNLGSWGAMRWKNEKKADIVDTVYGDMQQRFVLTDSFSYNPFSEGGRAGSIRKLVENYTEKDIKDYAERVSKARTEREERIKKYKKALENPETKEEFLIFIERKGKDKLSPEQLKKYDELTADENIEQRQIEKETPQTKVVAKTDVEVGMKIIPGVHTKKGHKIWTVTLSDRVSRENYLELQTKAKKLGGYYSSYRGQGATPGFVFQDEDSANNFVGLKKKDAIVEQQPQAKAPNVNKAAEKMRALADSIEAKSDASLSQDRLANTARRARMAASAERQAESEKAFAKTFRNIADGIEAGEIKYLAELRNMTQLESLYSILNAALSKNPNWDRNKGRREPIEEDVAFAKFPEVELYINIAQSVATDLQKYPGGKKLAIQLNSRINKTSGTILRFHDDDMELAKDISKVMKKYQGTNGLGWQLHRELADRDRLHRMGIETEEHLRAALRELTNLKVQSKVEDSIKKMERQLIGSKIPGYFPTPKTVVQEMVQLAGIEPGMSILEPSAGKGNIADLIKESHADNDLSVIEWNHTLKDILTAKKHNVVAQDFLEHDRTYDRIVMNPPFENFQDVDHVKHAYKLLNPGGKIVSIMSEAPFFRSDKKAQEFRDWLDDLGGYSKKLPEKSFISGERPTGVNTRLVVIEKDRDAQKSIGAIYKFYGRRVSMSRKVD